MKNYCPDYIYERHGAKGRTGGQSMGIKIRFDCMALEGTRGQVNTHTQYCITLKEELNMKQKVIMVCRIMIQLEKKKLMVDHGC